MFPLPPPTDIQSRGSSPVTSGIQPRVG